VTDSFTATPKKILQKMGDYMDTSQVTIKHVASHWQVKSITLSFVVSSSFLPNPRTKWIPLEAQIEKEKAQS
jgi:hypothetical protein